MENFEDFALVVMEKDKAGILEQELGMYKIYQNEELIVNAFAAKDKNGVLYLHLLLKADKELSDDDFENCYDYYDKTEKFEGIGVTVTEVEDCFYPTWDFSLPFDDDKMERVINELLECHRRELDEVYVLLQEAGDAG